MRIIKYLFLLFLLSIVSFSIFIATLKGTFSVERSKIISSKKNIVFHYTSNLKNFKNWFAPITADSLAVVNLSTRTVGSASRIEWNSRDSHGHLIVLKTVKNDSLLQKINVNDFAASTSISFKDTLGKTKVTWRAKGDASFLHKFQSFFINNSSSVFENVFEKSLAQLDRKLNAELNTYVTNVNGQVKRSQTYYLAQSYTSEISKVTKNALITIFEIKKYCEQKDIEINGNPFVIYHKYDRVNQLTKVSICLPILDSIVYSSGSKFKHGNLNKYDAIKASFTGYYIHNYKALNKLDEYIKSKKLTADPNFSHIEVYSTDNLDLTKVSTWKTELYLPLKSEPVIRSVVKKSEPISSPNNYKPEAEENPVEPLEIPSEF